jgi:hypothetical protein
MIDLRALGFDPDRGLQQRLLKRREPGFDSRKHLFLKAVSVGGW